MARLPFSALKGVAAAPHGVEAAAQHLLQELRRVGDHAARERLQKGEKSARPMSFQINIRR
ncbi:MAG: hypothetical protein GEU90_21675, partial [Gemmatimonas sp.]|nr:hypothetical protein [Gemmatimonas sp.]